MKPPLKRYPDACSGCTTAPPCSSGSVTQTAAAFIDARNHSSAPAACLHQQAAEAWAALNGAPSHRHRASSMPCQALKAAMEQFRQPSKHPRRQPRSADRQAASQTLRAREHKGQRPTAAATEHAR